MNDSTALLTRRALGLLREKRSPAQQAFRRRMRSVEKRAGRGRGYERDFDPNVGGGTDRDKMPDSDFAGPDRSFPIKTAGDVSDALMSLGRAKGDRNAIRRRIIAIAKRKGFSLPDSAKGK